MGRLAVQSRPGGVPLVSGCRGWVRRGGAAAFCAQVCILRAAVGLGRQLGLRLLSPPLQWSPLLSLLQPLCLFQGGSFSLWDISARSSSSLSSSPPSSSSAPPSLHFFLPPSSPSHLPFSSCFCFSLLPASTLSFPFPPFSPPYSPFAAHLILGNLQACFAFSGALLGWRGTVDMGAGGAFSVCGSLPSWISNIPPNKQRVWPQNYPVWGPPLRTHSHRRLLLPFCPLCLSLP